MALELPLFRLIRERYVREWPLAATCTSGMSASGVGAALHFCKRAVCPRVASELRFISEGERSSASGVGAAPSLINSRAVCPRVASGCDMHERYVREWRRAAFGVSDERQAREWPLAATCIER